MTERTSDFLHDLLPTGGELTDPFDWSLGHGPAVEVSVGVTEERLLELAIPIEAFRKGTDCWQVITEGKGSPVSRVRLASAMGPDIEAAHIRLMGQLDILQRLATGPWT